MSPQGYSHSKKAGNRGDVWKHFVLLTVVEGMMKSPTAATKPCFRYRETHAGAGRFCLREKGEWRLGVGSILPPAATLRTHPYFQALGEAVGPGDIYSGSWDFVGCYLERNHVPFRITLNDTSSEVEDAIVERRKNGDLWTTVDFRRADGFQELASSEPVELTLIDPPYTPAQPDWRRCRSSMAELRRRAEDYLIWYPVYWPTEPCKLVSASGESGFEVIWAPMGKKPSQNPKGCGVIAGGATSKLLNASKVQLQEVARSLSGRLVIRCCS